MLEKNEQLTLDLFVEKWWRIGLSIEPADRPTAEWAMRWLYKTQQKRQPRIEWMTSPAAIAATSDKTEPFISVSSDVLDGGQWNRGNAGTGIVPPFGEMERILEESVVPFIALEATRGTAFDLTNAYFASSNRPFITGQFLAGTLGYYDYLTNEEEKQKNLGFEVYGLTNLALSAGLVLALKDVCYISERPISILLDEENRLHGEDVPAVAYADGFEVWVWHGNLVGKRIIKREFSWEDIQRQNNIEIRRSMIDIYGTSSYLIDAGAKEMHSDGFGTLYRLEGSQIAEGSRLMRSFDEPLVMVKVVNTTPEPDGSYKDYFLRVPPTMETAEQAVAWTFEMEAGKEGYRPDAES